MSREYVLHAFQAPANLQIDYAGELNEQQFAAVTAVPGPALVIAGAGSGKTRTLTYRVAYLLEQGIPGERILLLTFTNKAAKEMMRRVSNLLGGDLSSLWGGTFHSIANRLLRRHAERIGYRPDFTILDREDAKDLLKATIDATVLDITSTRFPKPERLMSWISMAANTERPVLEMLKDEGDFFSSVAGDIVKVSAAFAERKRAGNMMDFDDLLVLWLKLLREHSDLAEQYQRRFQFILVDEYQDTNKIQSDIIDLLAARHRNVMVVGDDSQSIYSWRGAHFLNILEFPKRYPGAAVYKIETNYRSTPEILAVANAAIAPNLQQFRKELMPSRKPGSKPALVVCEDAYQQAAFVSQRVLQLRDEGYELQDMAVLYRAHFHAMELQLELQRRNIPFSITSGIRFFEQTHVKDVVAYLKLATNPLDELAFKRIVQLLPGIGGKSAEKLWTCFHKAIGEFSMPPDSDVPPTPRIGRALQACLESVPKKAVVAWAQLSATLAQLEVEPLVSNPAQMISHVLEAGYEEYLLEAFDNHRARLEDLQGLASYAAQFRTTQELLSELALVTHLDAEEEKTPRADSEALKLSTVHQAKGLEFKIVFVIMLCDGLFPAGRSLDSLEDEEEERRLFYVAITRAKDELYLCYPLLRAAAAHTGDMHQQASRFLGDLPHDAVEEWNLRPFSD